MENKIDIKKYFKAIILFLIGQIFLVISTISFGANIKILPRWLESFSGFAFLAMAVFVFSLLILLKVKRYFIYSLVAVAFSFIASTIGAICSTSNDGLYYALAKGFELSGDFLLLIFYVYFFQGNYLIYKDLGYIDESRKTKRFCIAFLIVFLSSVAVQNIAKIPAISYNLIANRVFLYGSWLFEFAIYAFSLTIIIGIVVNAHKIKKEVKNNELGEE